MPNHFSSFELHLHLYLHLFHHAHTSFYLSIYLSTYLMTVPRDTALSLLPSFLLLSPPPPFPSLPPSLLFSLLISPSHFSFSPDIMHTWDLSLPSYDIISLCFNLFHSFHCYTSHFCYLETKMYYTILHHTTLHHNTPQYTTLSYTHYTALHCTYVSSFLISQRWITWI